MRFRIIFIFVMKRKFLIIAFTVFSLFIFSGSIYAQKQIEPKIDRDPLLEAESLHDLDVARQAFKLRKAYKEVLLRTEVIVARTPEFSRMEEVLYLTGMSSYYFSIGKGKQKINPKFEDEKKKFAPEKLRENAAVYLSQLIEQFPKSKYKTEAEKTLKLVENKK